MPQCCALRCTNSPATGHKMNAFPRDPKRRSLWTKNMNRGKDWMPTLHSHLCEVHFETDMWEKLRQDGKKKLKSFAFPTIFQGHDTNAGRASNSVKSRSNMVDLNRVKIENVDEEIPNLIKSENSFFKNEEHDMLFVEVQILGTNNSSEAISAIKEDMPTTDEDISKEEEELLECKKKNRVYKKNSVIFSEFLATRESLKRSENLRRKVTTRYKISKIQRNQYQCEIKQLKEKIKHLEQKLEATKTISNLSVGTVSRIF